MYVCITTCTLGGSGGMLSQKILDFRLSEVASGAFSGIDFVLNREFGSIHCRLASFPGPKRRGRKGLVSAVCACA